MSISNSAMQAWCEQLLAGRQAAPNLTLTDYVAAAPKLKLLENVPSGTAVLIRGDVDAKPGKEIGEGDIRLRSMLDTLKFGIERGWKQVIFGHIGRKPEGSLQAVADRFRELLEQEVELVPDWVDEENDAVTSAAADLINTASPGSVIVLENTRRYEIERLLWKAEEADLPQLAPRLATFANSVAEKISTIYIHEAFSAGSLDTSSTVIPAAMQQAVMGAYEAEQFTGPITQCLETQLVVFSGLKIDKLDDLEAMIARGKIKRVFSAGSLAMALMKGTSQLDGQDVCLGVAEDEAHSDKPYYIPADRIEQAKAMIADGREKGIEFVLPVDFVIQDGSVAETLKPSDQQFDIGPKTSELFEQKVGEFIEQAGEGAVAFHNGVFGMFEDERFEEGTRRFVSQLKRMHDAGVHVYIGGGEGGKSLDKYGEPEWVTHVFTAGGTVLNALGSEPVPYLVALKAASSAE